MILQQKTETITAQEEPAYILLLLLIVTQMIYAQMFVRTMSFIAIRTIM